MSADTVDTSVRTEITLEVPLERAFRVFTERFDHIKPPEHNMLAVDIAQSVFEPQVGGRIYDRGVDGSECQWGRVLTYDPPTRLVFSWDISPRWQIETDLARSSEVEVRFIAEGERRTRGNWNTAISNGTAKAGKASPPAFGAIRAGRSTCNGSPKRRAEGPQQAIGREPNGFGPSRLIPPDRSNT